jgi:hypothetical protein
MPGKVLDKLFGHLTSILSQCGKEQKELVESQAAGRARTTCTWPCSLHSWKGDTFPRSMDTMAVPSPGWFHFGQWAVNIQEPATPPGRGGSDCTIPTTLGWRCSSERCIWVPKDCLSLGQKAAGWRHPSNSRGTDKRGFSVHLKDLKNLSDSLKQCTPFRSLKRFWLGGNRDYSWYVQYTVTPWYLGEMASSSASDTQICRCSSPLYKMM